jgi:Fe-S cluster assembly iron-binding protein IscA
MSSSQLRNSYNALRRSARDLDLGTLGFDYGFDFATGFGLLDAYLAVTALETDGLFLSLAPVSAEVLAGQEISYQLTVVNLSANPLVSGRSLADTPGGLLTPRTQVAHPPGDFNQDGCIDMNDQAILLTILRWPLILDLAFDLSGDGRVDLDDLKDLVRRYTYPGGQLCV